MNPKNEGPPSPGGETPNNEIRVKLDWSTEPMPIYSNGASVTVENDIFHVAFSEVTPSPDHIVDVGGEKHLRARVVASIRMTPVGVYQFLHALASRWNRYASQMQIPPDAKAPKFKILHVPEQLQLQGLTDGEKQ